MRRLSRSLVRENRPIIQWRPLPLILERIRRGQHIEHYEAVRRRKDERLLDVSLTISPIVDAHGRVVDASKIARDIAGGKLAEAALVKSEKLAAAGRLAATLAHEINNPLQAVTNLMSLLGKSPRLDTHEQAFAAMAEEELGRVVRLTQQSLSFYRESTYPVAVNVEEVLDSVINLYVKRLKTKDITVAKRYRSDAMTINSYPGEIRQIFSTLLLNAMDATNDGGTISIRVHKSLRTRSSPIRGVRVSIVDNGVGVPAHNTARIFEPFLPPRENKGLALAFGWQTGL